MNQPSPRQRWGKSFANLFASRMGATTVEVPSSHVAMVSHPDEVTQLIKTAAETCATSSG
jgi:hypothetical protein